MNSIGNGQEDVLQQFLELLQDLQVDYCVIGGLAVNAYVEPVVSLDLDIVATTTDVDELAKASKGLFAVKEFPHSLNLTSEHSELRIQLQKDSRYQDFIVRAATKAVMGYEMKIAALEDVLQGKIWAYSDETRRQSKRQKDLADILRLTEAFPHLKDNLPESIRALGLI